MRPIKAIMALLAAIIILPACNEEEWENLTYEQKVIETLLKQQKPKHDIGHELVDSMRYVILKTGVQIGPEEAHAGLHIGPDPNSGLGLMVTGADYFVEYYDSHVSPYLTDTVGIVRSLSTLRQELKVLDDSTLIYKGYKVVGIEDVTVEKGPIMHWLGIGVDNEKDAAKVVEYMHSLDCKVVSINSGGYFTCIYINIALPLHRKAIPTRDILLDSKLKLIFVDVMPYLAQFGGYY